VTDETYYVYLITTLGGFHTKIGISSNPHARLLTMQTGSPLKLYLCATFACPSRAIAEQVEREAHTELAEWRLHGEWFDLPDDLCHEPIAVALSRYLQ
jgi:hypothetical protein